MTITKDTILGDILDAAPETARINLGDAPEVPIEDPPVDPDEEFRKAAQG